MFVAWESFIEASFTKFLCGEPSTTGLQIVCCATPRDLEHAQKMVIGVMKYVDWSHPEVIRKLAAIYFEDGHPFSTLISAIQSDLFDLRTIRNAAAHITSTTTHQLDALGQRKLRRPCLNIGVPAILMPWTPILRTLVQS